MSSISIEFRTFVDNKAAAVILWLSSGIDIGLDSWAYFRGNAGGLLGAFVLDSRPFSVSNCLIVGNGLPIVPRSMR
jgi:hypothetical protein